MRLRVAGSLAVVVVLSCAGAAHAKGPSLADGLYRLDVTRDRLAVGEPLAVVAWFDPRAACERFLGDLPDGGGVSVDDCASWIVGEELALYTDTGWITVPLEPCGAALCGWAETAGQPAGTYHVAGVSYPDPRLGDPTVELLSGSDPGSDPESDPGSDPAADPEKEITDGDGDGGGCAAGGTGGTGGAALALLALLSAVAARPRARSRRRRPT